MKEGTFIHIILNLMLLAVGFAGGVLFNKYLTVHNVLDYSSCVAAGNEILNTFPSQCVTSNGRTFVDQVSGGEKLTPRDDESIITGFENCVADGNKIRSGSPRSCSTSNGKVFLEEKGLSDFPLTDVVNTGGISSYEDCINAGFSAIESLPRQCKTPNGETFTEGLTTPDTLPSL